VSGGEGEGADHFDAGDEAEVGGAPDEVVQVAASGKRYFSGMLKLTLRRMMVPLTRFRMLSTISQYTLPSTTFSFSSSMLYRCFWIRAE
jgi:hypothetical protein